MTLYRYQKRVIGVQTFAFGLPIISAVFDPHALTFPPIGDGSGPYKLFALAIIGASAFLPYFLLPKSRRGLVVGVLFALLVISGCIYVGLNASYAVTIPRPSGSPVYVIRGTLRNPNLKPPYDKMSDEQLIEYAGQTDEALELAYSRSSLLANRAKVFAAYVTALVLLELFLGSCAAEKKEPDTRSITPDNQQ
jgi:hypothetical protein